MSDIDTNCGKHNLEGLADELHESILAEGASRFPMESYAQLLGAGATPDEAMSMLGFSPERLPSRLPEPRA